MSGLSSTVNLMSLFVRLATQAVYTRISRVQRKFEVKGWFPCAGKAGVITSTLDVLVLCRIILITDGALDNISVKRDLLVR